MRANEQVSAGSGWGKESYGQGWDELFVAGAAYGKGADEVKGWVVPGFMPRGYLVVLGAASKTGKSCLATALAMAVAKGEPFLVVPVEAGPVLWAAYEETEAERMGVMRTWGSVPGQFYTSHKMRALDSAEGFEALAYWVLKTGARLLVVDPLYAAAGEDSLASGKGARRVLSGLKDICASTGVTILVLHHLTKMTGQKVTRDRIAESGQILATASMDLLMEARSHPEGGRLITLRGRGRGEFANRLWTLRSFGVGHYEAIPPMPLDTTYGRVEEAIREAEGPVTVAQIAEATGLHVPTVRNQVTALVRDGVILGAGRIGKALAYVVG